MNDMGDEKLSGNAIGVPLLLFLTFIVFLFMTLLIDYFGTFTVKETIDHEFKNIVVNKMTQYLTDEYSSDYIAKFEDVDKIALEDDIKTNFVQYLASEKHIIVEIKELTITNPSDLTIICKFTGNFEFTPIIGKGAVTFKLPAEAKAKVIRFDEL